MRARVAKKVCRSKYRQRLVTVNRAQAKIDRLDLREIRRGLPEDWNGGRYGRWDPWQCPF